MLSQFKHFQEFILEKDNFVFRQNQLINVINKYNFLFFSSEKINDEIENRIKESNVVVINNYEEENSGTKSLFFIFGFKNSILIITKDALPNLVRQIQKINVKIAFSFISDTKEIFDRYVKCKYNEFNDLYSDEYFQEELCSFDRLAVIKKYREIWRIIFPCISGYLIKQSYSKTKYTRIQNQSIVPKEFFEKDCIELRTVGHGACFRSDLVYHVKDEQFYVIKKPYNLDEAEKLAHREIKNYRLIKHPFIPKYYGATTRGYHVIEFINGKSLIHINELKLSESEKIKMIVELLNVFEYLQKNDFVYRDLKPDNVMLDENKTIVLIDFDRMIKISDITNDQEFTKEFGTEFIAPEVNSGKITFENDIYSIGKMILFILDLDDANSTELSNEYKSLYLLVRKLIDENPKNRLSLSEFIVYFNIIFWDITKYCHPSLTC